MNAAEHSVRAVYLKVAPADIALVKFLFESYEGVGVVRTVDRRAAIIVVLVVPDLLPVARAILRDLHAQIACAEISPPVSPADDWLLREIDGDD